ncbi:MAG: SMI1/KNR4 family protein [Gammaproteobacteria bacterium]|nr:SMI1/KNR4 family protein [Gammaproteobacteria bacterium]
MEDVIDILRERNEPVPVPLDLPDEDLLVEIEEELLISMPDDLRFFLLTVSDVVYGKLEPVTVTDRNSHTYLPEVAAVAWSLGLPRRYLPICESNGAYYCISQDGTVLLWDQRISDESWENIWQWAREVWLAE